MNQGPETARPAPTSPLLTRAEAWKYLRICERHLHAITKAGHVPAIKIGTSVRYAVADLDAYIQRRGEGNRTQNEVC